MTHAQYITDYYTETLNYSIVIVWCHDSTLLTCLPVFKNFMFSIGHIFHVSFLKFLNSATKYLQLVFSKKHDKGPEILRNVIFYVFGV